MKFATKPKVEKTVNYMGEDAYVLSPKERLLNITATCMFGEPKYYEGSATVSQKIFDTCDEIKDPEFILKLALYLRNELYLRTTPIALLIKAANMESVKDTILIRKYSPAIIQRADELTETIAGQLNLFKKPIPNSLKRGVAKAFHKFDAYQLTKYKNDDKAVKLRDVIRIVHPKPLDEKESSLYKSIVKGTLKPIYTWETELSAKGNNASTWHDLINSKKVGYMALLRNLRNIVNAGVSIEDIKTVANYLTNEKAVINSKQLPHRFLSAFEALEEVSITGKFESENKKLEMLKTAVQKAIEMSADLNIPKIKGKTVVIADNSGSARGDSGGVSKVSTKSVRTMADLGNLLSLLTWYACKDTIFGVFGDRLIFVTPDRKLGILKNFEAVNEAGERVGASSENGVFLILEKMISEEIFADRIIVCSDLQIGDGKNREYGLGNYSTSRIYGENTVPSLVAKYRREVNPNFMYYSICFNGYGNDVIMGEKKVLINGWSDQIFKFINTVEQDPKAQLKYIESIAIDSQ